MKTISRLDYLKDCVRERKGILKRIWYSKAFTIPDLKDEDESKLEHLDICIKRDGLYAVYVTNGVKEVVKINDFKRDQPLYSVFDEVEVDKTVMLNIEEKNTTVGRLIRNAVVIPKDLETKLPYMNRRVVTSDIEAELAKRVKNEDETKQPDSILVPDMIRVIDNLNFLDSLGTIFVVAATPKTVTRAPGVDKYVKKLLEEAGDDIRDPVKLVEIENKVQAYDQEYLKDDIAAQTVFTGKTKVGRFKLYGMFGSGLDFVHDRSNDTTITRSISDGLDPDPNEVPKYFNDLRYASFSRGDNTALGGSIYKELQRSLNTIKVTPTPCKTTRGVIKVMTPHEARYAMGRFIKVNNVWKPLTTREEIEAVLGKTVEMRSPRFCKEKDNGICYACMTARYKNLANGVSNMAAQISDTLLNMFLKLMHGIKADLVKIEKEDLIN